MILPFYVMFNTLYFANKKKELSVMYELKTRHNKRKLHRIFERKQIVYIGIYEMYLRKTRLYQSTYH